MYFINLQNSTCMKKIAITLLLILVVALAFGLYQYSRPASLVTNVQPEFSLSATELKKELSNDPSAENRFTGKTVLVEGQISLLEEGQTTTVLIDSSVRCEFSKDIRIPQQQEQVKIKGLFAGYDKLFDEVLLIKCSIEKLGK